MFAALITCLLIPAVLAVPQCYCPSNNCPQCSTGNGNPGNVNTNIITLHVGSGGYGVSGVSPPQSGVPPPIYVPGSPPVIPPNYHCPAETPNRPCFVWVNQRGGMAPDQCDTDEECCKPGGAIMKCCMDTCLGHRTCKPPLVKDA